MNYTILSNKWRPKNLDEVVGQEESIYTIKNIIKSKSIHNAYLISGQQGTGKTSLARIIIKCINCKINITINPCNKCSCCIEIENDTNIDSIEIDAASKTKVEEIKEIINSSHYKNTQNRFKTYIIDECHMLSINSFNYLLKILEETKYNIIYILITTQLEKIPETIISRCINLNLKKISKNNIKKRLLQIFKNENLNYNDQAVNKLIDFSNGSMRQTLNTLEKLNKTKYININSIQLLLGLTSDEKILLIIKNIYDADYNNLIKNTKILINNNHNMQNILTQIQIMLYKISLHKLKINYDKNDIKNTIFLYLSNKLTMKNIETIYKTISKEKKLIDFSPNINIAIEMILIQITNKLIYKNS